MKQKIFYCLILSTFILSGCFGRSVESELSSVINDLNKAETKYNETQVLLIDMETKEQKFFNDVMGLTQKQYDQLLMKVVEMEEMLVKRVQLIEQEKASMEEAHKLLKEFDPIISTLEGQEKSKVEQLKEAFDDRYALHSTFVIAYEKLTTLQKELYEMIAVKDTHLPKLQEKVKQVNDQNERVQSAIDAFNNSTVNINQLKDEVFSVF
ncbi:YkyA family protein [Sporosarcina sp. HYO08]|uniref:YkyA family protein n=1 Tax=Sporosarcina sp. HYO08 TaxID=1759557 RepID=UPI0007919358|nr:YkyA family protein [Sporosarcina sp. HYO08]KXH79845.1 hypothetical protein AU377_10210 [Sporosarcina sp. HYO08]